MKGVSKSDMETSQSLNRHPSGTYLQLDNLRLLPLQKCLGVGEVDVLRGRIAGSRLCATPTSLVGVPGRCPLLACTIPRIYPRLDRLVQFQCRQMAFVFDKVQDTLGVFENARRRCSHIGARQRRPYGKRADAFRNDRHSGGLVVWRITADVQRLQPKVHNQQQE